MDGSLSWSLYSRIVTAEEWTRPVEHCSVTVEEYILTVEESKGMYRTASIKTHTKLYLLIPERTHISPTVTDVARLRLIIAIAPYLILTVRSLREDVIRQIPQAIVPHERVRYV